MARTTISNSDEQLSDLIAKRDALEEQLLTANFAYKRILRYRIASLDRAIRLLLS